LADTRLVKDWIKAEAARLGFVLAGVTHPNSPEHFTRYEQWLAAGRHAEMAYLARQDALQARLRPRQLMETCHSILVLAYPYAPPAVVQPQRYPQGRIAAYALGADYHRSLPDLCKQLIGGCTAIFGSLGEVRIFADSAPILERELASRAGLGWIGKNGCLIHPHHGSYFLLVEVFLEIELPPDAPFAPDRCGTCRRCVDACPTGCILPDRSLDAGRCIAYLTIEKRGEAPEELRGMLAEWVFGCDICQMVCPWNRKPRANPQFQTLLPATIPLEELLRLTPADFAARFRPTPVERTRYRGLLRNALIAAGNAGDESLLPLLERYISSTDAILASHAAWAVAKLRQTSQGSQVGKPAPD